MLSRLASAARRPSSQATAAVKASASSLDCSASRPFSTTARNMSPPFVYSPHDAVASSARAPTYPPTASPSGKTLAGQAGLPHLPVPALQDTAAKYLTTVKPLVTPAQYAETEKAVASLLSGEDKAIGEALQDRLLHRRDQEGRDSWLSDWWNDAAYMGYRDPVVPHVSYFYSHKDDKSRRSQATRAASLVKAFLAFRRLVESQQLEPEKTKSGPLCMASYAWMFNSSRVPAKPSDLGVKYNPAENNHLVVLRKGHFFEFDLVPGGQELTTREIEEQLNRILAHPSAQNASPAPVGALTSDNRDRWADAREALLKTGGEQNRKALERIESSVIVLALDDTKPVTREDVSFQLWGGNATNRFYDKQQLIVFENGKSGYNGEHSCMDGTPTLRCNDFALSALAANKIDHGDPNAVRPGLAPPTPITFSLTSADEKNISSSISRFSETMSKHDLYVLNYEGYGKDVIKKAKVSPDAWAQMVIQLAHQKMFGKPAATYESAQTRKFKYGRTEVIRSVSEQSKAFAEAMEDPNASDDRRYELFQAAVKRHLEYASAAADGRGVDRHLFGLKQLLREGEKTPTVFTDSSFTTTSHWKLSTSQISSESFDSWGYGEVVPDGYGLAYAIKARSLTFTITSLKQDTATLRHYLAEAATDVREMVERVQTAQAKAKL